MKICTIWEEGRGRQLGIDDTFVTLKTNFRARNCFRFRNLRGCKRFGNPYSLDHRPDIIGSDQVLKTSHTYTKFNEDITRFYVACCKSLFMFILLHNLCRPDIYMWHIHVILAGIFSYLSLSLQKSKLVMISIAWVFTSKDVYTVDSLSAA